MFEASLGYLVSFRTAQATECSLCQSNNNKINKCLKNLYPFSLSKELSLKKRNRGALTHVSFGVPFDSMVSFGFMNSFEGSKNFPFCSQISAPGSSCSFSNYIPQISRLMN